MSVDPARDRWIRLFLVRQMMYVNVNEYIRYKVLFKMARRLNSVDCACLCGKKNVLVKEVSLTGIEPVTDG